MMKAIPPVKINKEEMAAMRGHTMACWWPSRITGRTAPNWEGIFGELARLVEAELLYFAERGHDFNRLWDLQHLCQLAKDRSLGR